MGGRDCEVCKEAPSKYKCPACRTPYCSVACFKNHKEEFCQKSSPQEETQKSSSPEEIKGTGSLEDGISCCHEKDQPLSSSPNTVCPAKAPNTACPAKALEARDPSWFVDHNKLKTLVELDEIRDALKDPELQKMILKIDGSQEPEKELEKVMEGQVFRQFTEKILDIVSPQE